MRLRNLTEQRLIEEWVDAVVAEYQKSRPDILDFPFPIVDLAEQMFLLRCDLVAFPTKHEHIDGVLYAAHGRAIINRDRPSSRIAFTVAHELAHWILEGHSPNSVAAHSWLSFLHSRDTRVREALANYLAGALLLPRQLLVAYLRERPLVLKRGLANVAASLGVSGSVLRIRLELLEAFGLHLKRTGTLLNQTDERLREVGLHIPIEHGKDGDIRSFEWRRRFRPWLPSLQESLDPCDSVLLVGDFKEIDIRLIHQVHDIALKVNQVFIGCYGSLDELAAALELRDVAGGANLLPDIPLTQQLPRLETIWKRSLKVVYLPDQNWRQFTTLVTSPQMWMVGDGVCNGELPYYGRDEHKKSPPRQPGLLVSAKSLNSVGDAKRFIRVHRKSGKRVILATGCFDVMTIAHVRFLKEAKAAGDLLIVGVEHDRRVSLFKGVLRPANSISERVEVLEELECVDFVFVINGTPTPALKEYYTRLYGELRPNALAVTEGDPNLTDRKQEIESAGGQLITVCAFGQGKSTTTVLQHVIRENMAVPQMWHVPRPLMILTKFKEQSTIDLSRHLDEEVQVKEQKFEQLRLPV